LYVRRSKGFLSRTTVPRRQTLRTTTQDRRLSTSLDAVRESQPVAQLARRFVRRFPVKRHQGGGAAGNAGDLRSPLLVADARDLDEVLASIDGFSQPMNVHVSTPPMRVSPREPGGTSPTFARCRPVAKLRASCKRRWHFSGFRRRFKRKDRRRRPHNVRRTILDRIAREKKCECREVHSLSTCLQQLFHRPRPSHVA
jgi:hypothetical protein